MPPTDETPSLTPINSGSCQYSFKGFHKVQDLVDTHLSLQLALGSVAHARAGDPASLIARNNVIILFQLLGIFEEFFTQDGNEEWIWDVIRSEWALGLNPDVFTPANVKFVAETFYTLFDFSFHQRNPPTESGIVGLRGSMHKHGLEVADELLLQLVRKWIDFRRSQPIDKSCINTHTSKISRLVNRIIQWRGELAEFKSDLLTTKVAAYQRVDDHTQGDSLGPLCRLLYGRVRNLEAIIGYFIDTERSQLPIKSVPGPRTKRLANEVLEKESSKKIFDALEGNQAIASVSIGDKRTRRSPATGGCRTVSDPRIELHNPSVYPRRFLSSTQPAFNGKVDIDAAARHLDNSLVRRIDTPDGNCDKLDSRIDELEEKVDRIDNENLEYMMGRFRLVDRDIDVTDEQVTKLEEEQVRLAGELRALELSQPAVSTRVQEKPLCVLQQALQETESHLCFVEAENTRHRGAIREIDRQWPKLTRIVNGLTLRLSSAESSIASPKTSDNADSDF